MERAQKLRVCVLARKSYDQALIRKALKINGLKYNGIVVARPERLPVRLEGRFPHVVIAALPRDAEALAALRQQIRATVPAPTQLIWLFSRPQEKQLLPEMEDYEDYVLREAPRRLVFLLRPGKHHLASSQQDPNPRDTYSGLLTSHVDTSKRASGPASAPPTEDLPRVSLVLEEGTRLNYWELNLETQEVYFSPQWKQLFGYQDHELPNTLDSWQAIALDPTEGLNYSASPSAGLLQRNNLHRFRHKDGSTVFALSQALHFRDDTGRVVRLMGFLTDVTSLVEARRALAESEEKLEFTSQALGLGLWDWDFRTGYVHRSPLLSQILRFPPESVQPNILFWEKSIHPEDFTRVVSNLIEHLDNESPYFQAEYRTRAGDGSWMWILDSGKVIERNADGRALRAVGAIQDIDELKRYQLEKTARETEVLAALVQGQDQERKRIARELHDGLGQVVTSVKMQFNVVKEHLAQNRMPPEHVVRELDTLVESSVYDVRAIAHGLLPRVLEEFGLVVALRNLCDNIQSTHRLKVQFGAINIQTELAKPVQASIYRIIQEVLNNVVKHAQADYVSVQITEDEEQREFILMMEDNGVGFDLRDGQSRRGMGLANLEARVQTLGGILTIDSSPGMGTSVMVEIPLRELHIQPRTSQNGQDSQTHTAEDSETE